MPVLIYQTVQKPQYAKKNTFFNTKWFDQSYPGFPAIKENQGVKSGKKSGQSPY